jgi:uncharacterized protein
MILNFSVANFRSIKEKQSFSMLAEQKVKEHPDNLIKNAKLNVLSSAGIYGRNASGKSNLITAISAMQYLVTQSSGFEVNKLIKCYEPYKLDAANLKLPTEFKMQFISHDDIKYDYEVIFSEFEIIKETLWFYPKNQIALLYERKKGSMVYGEYFTGRKKEIESSLYPNQLFLSKVGKERIDILVMPYVFFVEFFISAKQHSKYENLLLRMFSRKMGKTKTDDFNENINKLLKIADTGIDGLSVKEVDTSKLKLPEDMALSEKERMHELYKYQIRTIHKQYKKGKESGTIDFKLEDESTGTIKLLAIGGLIIEALAAGRVVIIDELDKSLHPKLTRELVKLFLNKKTNPHGAQLIFATHDVSLLNMNLLRRDQIWLADNENGKGSSYYAISDIPGVRNNIPFDKWYMSGKFGAVPVINDLEFNFKF